jgi:hypothetical protein
MSLVASKASFTLPLTLHSLLIFNFAREDSLYTMTVKETPDGAKSALGASVGWG